MITLMIMQVNASSVSIGPHLGYYKAADADEGAFIGGATCRLKFSAVLGAEASVSYRQEKYLNNAVTVKSWPIMVTGLIYPVPYLYGAIGAGWYNVTYDFSREKLPLFTDETVQEFGWHLGIGAEVPVVENVKLTGDFRYVYLDYDFQEMPGSTNLRSNFLVLTVGLLVGI